MSELLYDIAADMVVAFHFFWILFLIGGAIIGRKIRWVMWTHIAALGYSVVLQTFFWICPLTYLENWLRRRSGSDSYTGSFIAHYFEKLVYLDVSRGWIFLFTTIVIGISAIVYYKALLKLQEL
jgi:hypothetical protein